MNLLETELVNRWGADPIDSRLENFATLRLGVRYFLLRRHKFRDINWTQIREHNFFRSFRALRVRIKVATLLPAFDFGQNAGNKSNVEIINLL